MRHTRSVGFSYGHGKPIATGFCKTTQETPYTLLRLRKSFSRKMFQAALSIKLFKPINGSSRFRKHGCRPRVLHRIGQTAALGDGAKPVLVIFRHVLRIDGKERISRCIRSNPIEYADPIILWRYIRPFNMRSRRKELALSEEHQSAKRQEQRDPPPHLATQDIFAQDASAQQEQHNV